MKIKTVRKSYDEVCSIKKPAHIRPKKPSKALNRLVRLLSAPDLKAVDFSYTTKNMEKAGAQADTLDMPGR